jgi:hypothetical protein
MAQTPRALRSICCYPEGAGMNYNQQYSIQQLRFSWTVLTVAGSGTANARQPRTAPGVPSFDRVFDPFLT